MRSPRKVFYLITGLHIGGAERLLLDTVKELDKERFEPVVCALVGGGLIPRFEALGVKVYDLGMKRKWDLAAFARLKRILEEERPDILHTHLFHADLIGRILARMCRIPIVITTLHMLEFTRKFLHYNLPDRWASRFNDELIAVSQAVKDGFIKTEKLDGSKITVIQNGVADLPEVSEEARRNARERLTYGVGPVIGIVSRLDIPRKGHPVLFRAIHRLRQRYPEIVCAVIGSGPGLPVLQEEIRRLGLESHVVFVGAQEQVAPWLAAIDVFALPSLHEGFPMAIIEAMAARKPIVATPVGGVADLIAHEETGLLVPVNDDEALAKAIERLLSDKTLASQVADAARARFEARFAMHNLIKQTEALYDRWIRAKLEKPIKLLEVTTCLDSGGVTSHILDLIDNFPKGQFDVCLAAADNGEASELMAARDVRYVDVPMVKPIQPLADLNALIRLVGLMRKERFEIVHAHMAKAGFLASLAAKIAGVPTMVSTIHGPTRVTLNASWKQSLFEFCDKWSLSRLHQRAISVSHATTADLLRSGKIDQTRIVTIHNGIDSSRLEPKKSREAVRELLGLKPDQPVVAMVGRLADQKSPETLIHAMRQLNADWPEVVCLLIGDGPRYAELKAMISRYQLETQVRLLGNRADVVDLLHASDIFVLCTKFEGLSIAVLEAMALKLPVIATAVEGMEELVVPNETGVLIGENDASGCVQAMEALLRDPGLRKKMGEAAKDRVEKVFRLDRQIKATCSLLHQSASFARMWRGKGKSPSSWNRFRLFVYESGWKAAFKRVFASLLAPLYYRKALWFYARDLKLPFKNLRAMGSPCVVRRADINDARFLAEVSFESQDTIGALLTAPHSACFVAECQITKELGPDLPKGRIYGTSPVMAYQWVVCGPANVEILPYGRVLRLGPDEAYFYNCRTMKDFQGRGIGALVELEMMKWLKAEGYSRVLTDIRPDNAASCRMFEKLGFVRVEQIRLKKTLGKRTVSNFYPLLAHGDHRMQVCVVQDENLDSGILESLRTSVDIHISDCEQLKAAVTAPADVLFAVGFKALVSSALVSRRSQDRFVLTALLTESTLTAGRAGKLNPVKRSLLKWALRQCRFVWFDTPKTASIVNAVLKLNPRKAALWPEALSAKKFESATNFAGAAALDKSQWTWGYAGEPSEEVAEAVSAVENQWRRSLGDAVMPAQDGRWSQSNEYYRIQR